MKRYDMNPCFDQEDYRSEQMIESESGEWVRYDDIDEHLQYDKCKEALGLMLKAAHEADRYGELYDSFDGELLDMAKESLKWKN